MKVTLISDTHTKHNQLNGDLPGGDLLIHAGDFMNSGYIPIEAMEFFNWFDKINNYDTKVLMDQMEIIRKTIFASMVHLGNRNFTIGHLICLAMEKH